MAIETPQKYLFKYSHFCVDLKYFSIFLQSLMVKLFMYEVESDDALKNIPGKSCDKRPAYPFAYLTFNSAIIIPISYNIYIF
jgi:hypothetical protein